MRNEGRCFKSFLCIQRVNYFPLWSKDPHWPSVITSRGCRHSWNHFKSNLHHPVLCLFPIAFHVDKITSKWNKVLKKRRVGEKENSRRCCLHHLWISVGSWCLSASLPVCVRCTQSAYGTRSHRMCPRDRSLLCGLQLLSSVCWHQAGRSGWIHPCCGNV